MEIAASCVFDYKSLRALTHLSFFKKKNPKNQMVILFGVAMGLLALSISTFILGVSESILFAGIIILFSLFLLFVYFLLPRVQFKQSGKLVGTVNSYLFKDDMFAVNSDSAVTSGNSTIRYDAINKVMETFEYLFLFINGGSAFIVDKSTIENGTIEDIRQKFMPLLGKKYITCKY